MHVALKVQPVACRAVNRSGKPRVEIVLKTEDHQTLQQLVVEMTGVEP
jgi:hypothetical protein